MAKARISNLTRMQEQQVREQRARQDSQARQDTQAREASAWQAAAASNSAAAVRAFLQQYPDGANAPLARIRLAALDAPAQTATPKVAMLETKPTEATGELKRYNGRWTAYFDECGVSAGGYVVSYEISLEVVNGKYDLEVEWRGGEQRGFFHSTGSVDAKGNFYRPFKFLRIGNDVPMAKAQLPHDGGKGWFMINRCKVALVPDLG